MNVILATGIPELDAGIQQSINSVSFIGTALYREGLVELTERKQPNVHVIITSVMLEGVMTRKELVLMLRKRYPDTRIIFIIKEEDPALRSFLYQFSVFDIIPSPFGAEDIEQALFQPKSFKDVVETMNELHAFGKSPDLLEEERDTTYSTLSESEYEKMYAPSAGTNHLYQQIATFWSPRDHAGKTFSAVNTSLMLATSKSLKILLLDFNIDNPNIHLQFRIPDANRNLGALMEDKEKGKAITKESLNEYLITHPVYRNLKILPGCILKMKKQSEEAFIEAADDILHAAEQNNFSTILIDMDSGIRDLFTVHLLKKSTRILLHVAEEPGGLYAVKRLFDAEVGPFVSHLIDKKRVVPVLTKSRPESRTDFQRGLEVTLERRVGAVIEKSEDIIVSLYQGRPVLSKEPKEEMKTSFMMIANTIHQNLFKPPTPSTGAEKKKEKKSLFALLFAPFFGEMGTKKKKAEKQKQTKKKKKK